MTNKFKRILSLALALCLCLAMLPVLSFRADAASTEWEYPMKNTYVCGNDWAEYYSGRPERPYHIGIDIASSTGDTNIYAAADGTVAKTGWNDANGNYVVLSHTLNNKTIYSFYAHLASISVSSGSVSRGTAIGVMGNTGSGAAGRHLHFAITDTLKNGSYYGYATTFSGDQTTYGGVTYYNPHYVVANNALPGFTPTPDPDPDPIYDAQCFLDIATGGPNSVYVKGWAFDQDDPTAALDIHVYVGGSHIATLKANQYRPDVNEAFPGYGLGDYHGFEDTIPLDASIGGEQFVEVFGISVGGGNNTSGGSATVTVINDTTAPVISDISYTDLSSTGYTVTCTVTDDVGVDRVLFPTWTLEGDQDDLPSEWGQGTQNGNTFTYRVNISDHNNESGTYITHIYAYDTSGNSHAEALSVNVPAPDSVAPVLSEVHVYDITTDGYTVVCKATDNMGIDRVLFPTWTANNGQDDLTWGQGTQSGDYYTFRVNASEHNGETTGYYTHIYAYDADDNYAKYSLDARNLAVTADTQAPVISDVQITDLSAVGYTVICTVTDDQHVNRVQMPTWSVNNGQDDIMTNWGINAKARASADGTTYTYRVKISDHNNDTGIYGTHIYAYDDAGNLSRIKIEEHLGNIVVPEHLPLAEGLKDDFYAVIQNNVSLTVLTSTDDVVFSSNQELDTQLWHFVKNDDGTYMIYGAADETHVLDIELAKDSTDANVQMCVYNGSNAQKWYIHAYKGLYYLRPACSNQLLLDLPYASTADGAAAKINYPNLGGGEGLNLLGDILLSYTVTYDANGGTDAPATQTKVWGESLTLRNTAPARSGFTFLGWAASADADTVQYMPGDVYSADADLTLYAVWESNAPAEVASGWSGDTEWTLTSDGVLTFSGEGAMKNYTYKSEMPWYSYFDQITSVVIEKGVTSIGDYAFYGMGIESIEIPESVTAIGDYAFKNAAKINNVVLPSGLTSLGDSAFYACTGLTSIEIPASLWTVKPYTFKNCTALESVTFHEGNLQKISDGAFYNTALTELVLPDCLDILDVYSFKNCAQMESITIGSGLTELREAVFYGTAIPTITIPEGITKIGPYAFKNCVSLETIDLPESLTSVGEASFYACTALESVVFPDAVTTIGNYAFRKCAAMTSVTFGEKLTSIGECGFYGCTGLTEIVIPDKVTTIKPYAFKTCTGLTSVTLGSNVSTIGEGAFNTCTGLKTIVFPASVKTIGDYCFSGSEDLWKLTFQGDAPSIGTGAFKGLDAYAYYPGDNATWTSDIMQNYGGKLTWTAN